MIHRYIKKHPIKDWRWNIDLPKAAKVLHFGLDGRDKQVCVWIEHPQIEPPDYDSSESKDHVLFHKREFVLLADGEQVLPGYSYVMSNNLGNGMLHLYVRG